MDILQAKRLVIQAGRDLVNCGLIARSWGNVSCRVSGDLFVITPSGRNYLTLTEDEIVPVNARTLVHQGPVTPSSEKLIHAALYRMRPDMDFIIHTHQENASVMSVLGVPLSVSGEASSLLGEQVPCAGYGLPGTKALCRETEKAFSLITGNAVMMMRHGVVCTGHTSEEAFRASAALETLAENWLKKLYAGAETPAAPLIPCAFQQACRIDGGYCITLRNGDTRQLSFGERPPAMERECALLDRIFQEHPHLNFVLSSATDDVCFALNQGRLKTWLDDFAQLVGTQLSVMPPEPESVSRSLRHVSAALIRNMGALCFGTNESDAQAVRQLLEKNCKAMRTAFLYGSSLPARRTPEPINDLEALLMRKNYLKNYSKRY